MNNTSLTTKNKKSKVEHLKDTGCQSVQFPKDHDGIKAFVENDSERLVTHGASFVLLATFKEFQSELVKAKHNLKNCVLRIRQSNCGIHKSFSIKYSEFFYRKRGCNECSKDSTYSFAHRYFQALLTAYGIEFLSEETVKRTKLRVDFYIPSINKSYEIDGLIHAVITRFHRDAAVRLEKVKKRDRQKDILLRGNLTRIVLYDILADGAVKSKTPEEQFHLIRQYFIELYKETTGNEITHTDILIRQDTEFFYLNSRVQEKINRLKTMHGDHILFNHAENHFKILLSKSQQFRCTQTGKLFVRKTSSVLDPFFVCPHCINRAKQENQVYYPLLEPVAKNLVEELLLIHPEIEFANPDAPFKEANIYNTIRLRMRLKEVNKEFYMPLSQLRAMSIKRIRKEVSSGNYEWREIKTSRESWKKKLFIKLPVVENRKEENRQSELSFRNYRAAAMLYNKNLRNGLINDISPTEIIGILPTYVHKSTQAATLSVASFENDIIPFFAKQEEYTLNTQKEQYAGTNMPLLIKHKVCGCSFFATWSKINMDYRRHKKIICQCQPCFTCYTKSKAVRATKKSQADILKEFEALYNKNYTPKFPETEIHVRNPIEIIYLPTGEIVKASLDNFRRGKFKGPHKRKPL